MQDEVKEVKLLSCFAHDRGLLHTNKEIKKLEDLQGLKLRAPTRIVGEALRALGVTPVGMPVPQVPESLAQKVIDGVAIPWEVVPTVKVHELTKFHTELPGKPAFYTAVFFLAMNPAKYNSMPADLRDVVDKESGMTHAPLAGAMWDETGAATLDMVKKRSGNQVSAIAEDEKQRWMKACEPVVTKWIDDMKGRNIDGGKLAEAAKALIAKYDV
jgi:TRAP-type transport system periplasmic protein